MARRRLVSAVVVTLASLGAALGNCSAPAIASTTTRATQLETATGLTMTITSISPVQLTAGQPLQLEGTVTNVGTQTWTDANVYLSFNAVPATSRTALDSFATIENGIGTTVNDLGLFDEIGDLAPGGRKVWHLSVPFARLNPAQAGVYQIGATLLAANDEGRDSLADARVGTTIPYLPDGLGKLRPTGVVTLVPVTAPVLRRADGAFIDDTLAPLLASGGRLHNLLDFAEQAPPDSLEILLDPALRQAVTEMSDGYLVQTLGQAAQGVGGTPGTGRRAARAWLNELDDVLSHQQSALLPWGNPATSSLADAGMPGVVSAAVRASQRYGAANSLTQTVVDWQVSGSTDRLGLAVSRVAGAAIHVVSERSLPGLSRADPSTYPPAQVSIDTRPGLVTAVVARTDIGGVRFSSGLGALQFRQALMAEATVRSLSERHRPTSVVAAPFDWDPGHVTSHVGLAAGYGFESVAPESLVTLGESLPTLYDHTVEGSSRQPGLSTKIIDAVRRLRDNGHIYTDLLTNHSDAAVEFDQQLAMAGSATWRWRASRGLGLIRELSRQLAGKISAVTVTGPAFVAMSSSSGRFPLTVSNGLDVGVTVKIFVNPLNKALKIGPIEPLSLGPGQSRDIRVVSSANGSGVTQVRARLSTATDRRFGHPFDFNVRATQIGLAIWIAMGLGLALLLISAARRIYRRARGQGFKTRAESGP